MSYAFDLRQVCGGYAYFSTFTSGHTSFNSNYEIRRPSRVDIERFRTALSEIEQKPAFVDSAKTYQSWLCIQGWALIDDFFAKSSMQQWLKQHKCVKSSFGSFTDVDIVSPMVLKRSLRGKAKQQIHDRDGNRCLLCESDKKLTLQHVWPFSAGGETSSRNLVTLCETCNQKLRDEIYIDLYRLAKLPNSIEFSLLKMSDISEKAILRAEFLSQNLMHTRCELW